MLQDCSQLRNCFDALLRIETADDQPKQLSFLPDSTICAVMGQLLLSYVRLSALCYLAGVTPVVSDLLTVTVNELRWHDVNLGVCPWEIINPVNTCVTNVYSL